MSPVQRSLLFIEKIAACGDSHIKHVITLCEQMLSFAVQVVHQCVVVTVLLRFNTRQVMN
jgi:hypothetical protein